jgi:hypothetical protein
VVGPGFLKATTPGFPTNPDALTLDSDTTGRVVREINFDSGAPGVCKSGSFAAYDYFGDGSFYLLDAPGHSIAHMCAAARTSANPDTFVFMGADACHHVGVLRPSEWLHLPRELDPPIPGIPRCFGDLIHSLHPRRSDRLAFFEPSTKMFPDYEAALRTVKAMQEVEARGDVFMIIAHDHSLLGQIPFFPEKINGWRDSNAGERTRWLFCQDFNHSVAEEMKRQKGTCKVNDKH